MGVVGKSSDEWYAIGDAALRAGNIPEATEAFRSAVAVDASHANALYRLAEIARAEGDVAGAVALVERTLAVNPTHAGARKLGAKLQATGPPTPAPSAPPCPPSGAGVAGIAESVKRTVEPFRLRQGSSQVVAVRVRARVGPAPAGQLVAVELRGHRVRGSLESGDWVELPAEWQPGAPVTRVRNLSTCADVVVVRDILARIFIVLVVAFVAAWIVVLFGVVGRELFLSGS